MLNHVENKNYYYYYTSAIVRCIVYYVLLFNSDAHIGICYLSMSIILPEQSSLLGLQFKLLEIKITKIIFSIYILIT